MAYRSKATTKVAAADSKQAKGPALAIYTAGPKKEKGKKAPEPVKEPTPPPPPSPPAEEEPWEEVDGDIDDEESSPKEPDRLSATPFGTKLKPTKTKPESGPVVANAESDFLSSIKKPLRKTPTPSPTRSDGRAEEPPPEVVALQTKENILDVKLRPVQVAERNIPEVNSAQGSDFLAALKQTKLRRAVTPTQNEDSEPELKGRAKLMNDIRLGVQLRPTETIDKSSPLFRCSSMSNIAASRGDDELDPRERLLSEIRYGIKLKPTITNDRSSAVVPRTDEDEEDAEVTKSDAKPALPSGFRKNRAGETNGNTLEVPGGASSMTRSTSDSNLTNLPKLRHVNAPAANAGSNPLDQFLKEVKSGIRLKPTVTSDRSAPILKAEVDEGDPPPWANNESSGNDSGREKFLREIKGGVRLKSVKTSDRSAPVVVAEVEEDEAKAKTLLGAGGAPAVIVSPAGAPPPPPILPLGGLLPPPPPPPPPAPVPMICSTDLSVVTEAEWQAYIKICVLLDRPVKEIHNDLAEALKKDAPPVSTVQHWSGEFKKTLPSTHNLINCTSTATAAPTVSPVKKSPAKASPAKSGTGARKASTTKKD